MFILQFTPNGCLIGSANLLLFKLHRPRFERIAKNINKDRSRLALTFGCGHGTVCRPLRTSAAA
jgi:hypothetical protein